MPTAQPCTSQGARTFTEGLGSYRRVGRETERDILVARERQGQMAEMGRERYRQRQGKANRDTDRQTEKDIRENKGIQRQQNKEKRQRKADRGRERQTEAEKGR